jgi:phosphoribosylaminoimidazole-succinocarboxamide synthase
MSSLSSLPDITTVPERLSLQDVRVYRSRKFNPKDLPGELTKTYEGKVRKNYFIRSEKGQSLIISEASDRTSAFDIPNLIPQVPYKGKVLDTISKYWVAQIEEWGYRTDLVKDHGLAFSPNVAIAVREPLKTLPIEFVVRRYLTGTTDISLSSRYFKDEERNYGDFQYKALSKLETTDRNLSNLSLENPVDKKLLVTGLYGKIEKMVIDVFDKAEEKLKGSAVLLIDTKFELGLDKEDEVRFMDELLTPDSSRYWSK